MGKALTDELSCAWPGLVDIRIPSESISVLIFVNNSKKHDWATVQMYCINANRVRASEHLYDKDMCCSVERQRGECFRKQIELGKDAFSLPRQHFSRKEYV